MKTCYIIVRPFSILVVLVVPLRGGAVLAWTQLRSVGLIHFAPFAGQGAVESQTQGEMNAVQVGEDEGGKRGVY